MVTAAIVVANRMEDPVKLTDTQLLLLSAASQRDDRALEPSPKLTGGAAGKVVAGSSAMTEPIAAAVGRVLPVLLCLPTAPMLPLKLWGFGTSRPQLSGKAISRGHGYARART